VQSDRTAAALVMRQLDQLDARRAELVQRRDSARARLGGLVTAIGVTKVTIADQKAEIASARSTLAAEVIGDYKAGAPDATAYVLGAVSFADLVDRMDVLDRIDSSEVALIRRIAAQTASLRRPETACTARSPRSAARSPRSQRPRTGSTPPSRPATTS